MRGWAPGIVGHAVSCAVFENQIFERIGLANEVVYNPDPGLSSWQYAATAIILLVCCAVVSRRQKGPDDDGT